MNKNCVFLIFAYLLIGCRVGQNCSKYHTYWINPVYDIYPTLIDTSFLLNSIQRNADDLQIPQILPDELKLYRQHSFFFKITSAKAMYDVYYLPTEDSVSIQIIRLELYKKNKKVFDQDLRNSYQGIHKEMLSNLFNETDSFIRNSIRQKILNLNIKVGTQELFNTVYYSNVHYLARQNKGGSGVIK
ncbi:MAG: hypothetical protein H6607_05475 [Flavobacteriales bacterium]|nr:hypothetical protein [Flavobacteriales bacterium]